MDEDGDDRVKLGYLEKFSLDIFEFLGAYVFSEKGKNCLLASNGCTMFVSDELMKRLKNHKLDDAFMIKLVQHGLAYVPGKNLFYSGKEIEIHYFIIDLTKRCNFDCIYCFRKLDDHTVMKRNTLMDVLRYIERYCNKKGLKNIGIQLWGGEPALAMKEIEYVVQYFDDKEIEVSFDIETNGSLVTKEIALKWKQWGIHVGVSIDGPPRIQNIQIPLVEGGASSDAVERGICNLQKYYKAPFGGIVVVTKYNYRHVREMLDYFIYKLHLHALKFNIVRDNRNALDDRLGLEEEEVAWFANELMDYLEAFYMLGANFTEGNIDIRIRNLLERSKVSCCLSNGCQGGKCIISIDRNGDIFPCEMIDFQEEKIGSIYENEQLEDQIKKSISDHLFFKPKKDEECQKCPWWCYCGGGCSSRNRYAGRDGCIDKVECKLNKTIYPRLIEAILNGKIKLGD